VVDRPYPAFVCLTFILLSFTVGRKDRFETDQGYYSALLSKIVGLRSAVASKGF
jgi:hypothetical protein